MINNPNLFLQKGKNDEKLLEIKETYATRRVYGHNEINRLIFKKYLEYIDSIYFRNL